MLGAIVEFTVLAAIIATAGYYLTRAADQIAEITKFGRLLIGSILLAGATSLPELTVDISAVKLGMPDIAFGDLLGSSLMNLLILALLDLSHRSNGKMLSRMAASHALSATMSILLTSLVGMAVLTTGKFLKQDVFGADAWSWIILIAYLFGVRMVFIDQRISSQAAQENQQNESPIELRDLPPIWKPIVVFIAATVVLFFVGPRLADTAGRLADQSGLGKSFVGTTLVAFCTSLPELVASITAIRMGAFDLAIGNIFGSNAFNMILFTPLDLFHKGSLFTSISQSHATTAFAVIAASSIAVLGQLYHVEKRKRLIEPDAMLMLVVIGSALYLVFSFSGH